MHPDTAAAGLAVGLQVGRSPKLRRAILGDHVEDRSSARVRRGTASVTSDKAIKATNRTQASRAAESRGPKTIETPFQNARKTNRLRVALQQAIVKLEKSFADIGFSDGSDASSPAAFSVGCLLPARLASATLRINARVQAI
jgi:hypothetical protein